MSTAPLDRIDRKILDILQREGRIAITELAQRVGLSTSPCSERVKRLEEGGVIRGYRADIDWVRAFKGSRVVVEVTLARHTAQDMRRFEERVAAAPEVVQCHATGGGVDYVMHVMSRDIDHYQRFIDSLLTDELGIEKYFTYIVTKVVKSRAEGLPDWAEQSIGEGS